MLKLQASYFYIDNPLCSIERWFNKFQYRQATRINQREIEVRWTERAERAFEQHQDAIIVELQLYFSCVVKKRVIFHTKAEFATTQVNRNIELVFRPIASAACDPREFALNHPAGKELSQGVAACMIPRIVELDYRQGGWEGQFHY